MDNVESGAQLLISYGPYAVLALFALLIAPYLTKQCLKIKGKGFNKIFTGSIAIGAWLVVISMVAYVTVAWTPDKVYIGKIGKLDPTMSVFSDPPASVDLFIKNDGAIGDRNSWGYALITDKVIKNKNACAAFTVNWTTRDESQKDESHAVDFEVPIKVLMTGRNLKFKVAEHSSEGDVFIFKDGKWVDKGLCEKITEANSGFFKAAYAADEAALKKISTRLQSSNNATRSQARKEMRRLTKSELNQLKGMLPAGSKAEGVVKKEIARR